MKTAGLLAALLGITASVAGAQATTGRECRLDVQGYDSTRMSRYTSAAGKTTLFVGGGYRARCAGTHIIVTSDSAEYAEDLGDLRLIGHAHYEEDSASVDADVIQYLQREEHIVAAGNVVAKSRTKITLMAAQAHYYRPIPGTRAYVSITAFGGRPHLIIRDSAKTASDSDATLIDADRIHTERDSLFYAGGNVVITRPDMIGTADSADANSSSHRARLIGGKPHLDGRGTRKFALDARGIDLYGTEKQVDRLFAKGGAVAVSDSLRLTADTLNIRLSNNRIDTVMAWGPGRAHAVSPDRDITANRLKLTMPGGQMQEVFAVGSARADTKADSTLKTTERDWIVGDTLIATFDKLAQGDTSQPKIRVLVSRGSARTFYQMQSKSRTDSLPSLNYSAGRQITVAFLRGAVDEVHVTGPAVHGISLEPLSADTAKTAPKKKPPQPGQQP